MAMGSKKSKKIMLSFLTLIFKNRDKWKNTLFNSL